MADHKKQRAGRTGPKRVSKRAHNVFARLDCDAVSYVFEVDVDAFDLAKFYKETGLTAADRNWSTVFYAHNERSGYHVHFNGSVTGKTIALTVAYYAHSATRPKREPFAETVMEWLGSFFRKPKERAMVRSTFSKPAATWRSRFNLPFKVTMAGSNAEVIIDGISLDLPTNSYGAMHGWLSKLPKQFFAMVLSTRPIAFATFRIEEEVPVHSEALKIFMEEVR